ncbi:MAG: HD-GYP domain-containing protein (c-di-GMP phosphodiesterase class II) [Kiritimatiellia bacterium]|jgi:HD-GYP domain-containing protein (c-di-GMP phosphodiesterase class II)
MSEYASHLTSLQKKATITATEDILSDKGVLLAKSGIELNQKICTTILRFKLLKPLEDSIAIKNQLNAKSIYSIITQFIVTDPWLNVINEKLGDKSILQRCCLRLEKFPILQQKLTVMQLELPDVFAQAVASAYLAHICAITNEIPQTEIEEHFLAGLVHDIGFLHINHNILKKQGDLSAEEWRSIQSHPVIGYEIVNNIANFPKVVTRAVLEHHENLDGSGYPRNKTAQDLGSLGQLINLLGNVIAIYTKKLKPQQRSLRGVIPVVQINMHSYSPNAVSTIIRALKCVPESEKKSPNIKIIKELIVQTQEKQEYIKITTNIIKNASQQLGYTHNNKEIFSLQNTIYNVILIMNSSGLNDKNCINWLSELESSDQQKHYNEVEDTQVMLSEIIYQIQTYQKNANLFISKNSTHPLSKSMTQCLEQVKEVTKPAQLG